MRQHLTLSIRSISLLVFLMPAMSVSLCPPPYLGPPFAIITAGILTTLRKVTCSPFVARLQHCFFSFSLVTPFPHTAVVSLCPPCSHQTVHPFLFGYSETWKLFSGPPRHLKLLFLVLFYFCTSFFPLRSPYPPSSVPARKPIFLFSSVCLFRFNPGIGLLTYCFSFPELNSFSPFLLRGPLGFFPFLLSSRPKGYRSLFPRPARGKEHAQIF